MRRLTVFLAMLAVLACPLARAHTDFGIGVSLPGISIGINQPAYPDLAPIPGYPVYYAPHSPYNYFFFDGLFWAFVGDAWYSSSWYNGPWDWVDPLYVPNFILRVPVRYYMAAPVYFNLWAYDYAPHWGDHWGHDWDYRRSGWNRWDRHGDWRPAPRPDYQRNYAGNRYPRQRDQQFAIRDRNYSYQPRETLTRRDMQLARSAERRIADRTGGSRDRHDQRATGPDRERSAGVRTSPRTDRDTRIASSGRDGRHASPRTRSGRAPAPTTRHDTLTHTPPPRTAPRDLARNDRRGSSTQRSAPPPRHAQRDDRRAPSTRAAPPRDSRIARAEPSTRRAAPSSRQRDSFAQRSAPSSRQRDSFAQRSTPQRHERIARAEPRVQHSAPAPRYEHQQRSPQRAAPQRRERAPTTMAQRQPRSSSHAQQPRTEQRRSDSRQEKSTRDSDREREQRRRVQYSA